KLAAGEITQEEYDAIKAKKEEKGKKLDEKLAAGEITQEEYDAIKSEKNEKHKKMPAKGKGSKQDSTATEATE
ncbi:MAG: SHOCT domain-containing protein, partial [Clostridia bacterium]|nr:SHOCT domain-containing protein [Clostridia bacterium]